MIKVFSPTDTVFTTNGDAVIKGLRAVVRKADNSYFELELESGLEYIDHIKPNNIIVVNTPQGDQGFRVRQVEATRTKIKALCKHLYYVH